MSFAGDRPDLAALLAWAPELAKIFVSLASDIALVIGCDGVIGSVAQGGADRVASAAQRLVGRSRSDTVNVKTRQKMSNLLFLFRTQPSRAAPSAGISCR